MNNEKFDAFKYAKENGYIKDGYAFVVVSSTETCEEDEGVENSFLMTRQL